jgi:hypothetical protein
LIFWKVGFDILLNDIHLVSKFCESDLGAQLSGEDASHAAAGAQFTNSLIIP